MNESLHAALEDIVYAWSLAGTSADRLIDELHDYLIEAYGPPF